MEVGLQMVFASYGWDDVSDNRYGTRSSGSRASPRISASTCCGRSSIISTIIRFAPTISSSCPIWPPSVPNVDLGTAAVILPWHDPLRVAEQAAVLDYLSGAGCVSAWVVVSPGGSSRRSGAQWTNRGGGSTRRRR